MSEIFTSFEADEDRYPRIPVNFKPAEVDCEAMRTAHLTDSRFPDFEKLYSIENFGPEQILAIHPIPEDNWRDLANQAWFVAGIGYGLWNMEEDIFNNALQQLGVDGNAEPETATSQGRSMQLFMDGGMVGAVALREHILTPEDVQILDQGGTMGQQVDRWIDRGQPEMAIAFGV